MEPHISRPLNQLQELALEEWKERLREVEDGGDLLERLADHNFVEVQVIGGPLDGCVLECPEAAVRAAKSLEDIVLAAEGL